MMIDTANTSHIYLGRLALVVGTVNNFSYSFQGAGTGLGQPTNF